MSIVLLGPKHSGKTSVGKELAALLFRDFVDLDEFIAEHSGKTPRALYIEGPEVFKKAEMEALAAFFQPAAGNTTLVEIPLREVPPIIASGGGIIDNPGALALLKKNDAVMPVFLDVSAQTAWERISQEKELPPFLKTEDPRETHRLLHERRAAAYRQFASLIIKADEKSPGEIAQEIKRCI